ncbi:MAG: TonB-dependent receptor [Bacteroidaceae bacterium]|nr:TonB-dependent receptor [Bacteroidaceae bacterium]
MMRRRIVHIMFLLCISSLVALAQQQGEIQSICLDSIVVKERRRSLLLRQGREGSMVWDMRLMQNMPQILSNADPIHYAQMLPGVQTNNEYQGGIHVQGCDNEHNVVSVGGVPIYNVNHLLGFFSTFNATHFPSMSLTESAGTASFANRLGAELTMQPPETVLDSMSGDMTVGLIASQGTLRLPLSPASSLTLSARVSYINMLYSNWLRADENRIRYSFYDLNATYTHRIDSRNRLVADFYSGFDKADIADDRHSTDLNNRWGNTMGAVHWICALNGHAELKTTLYATTYGNRMQTGIGQEHFRMESRITDVGLRCRLSLGQRWTMGAEGVWHSIKPLDVNSDGGFASRQQHGVSTHSAEASVYADSRWTLLPDLSFNVGLRGNIHAAADHTFLSVNPSASIIYEKGGARCTFSYALRHQHLFQTGFSDVGMPTEFWFSADGDTPPQYARSFNLKGECYFFQRNYQASVSLYYKRLYRQVEYGGTMFDLMSAEYDWQDRLMRGKGENYGVSVMLSKCTGRLTGWVSYAYGRARRTYLMPEGKRTYPANHERPHELNVVLTYSTPRHWSFGTTFVACSGTPFTAPKAIYVMNGNVMALYGEHNANRLATYWRMDASVNYRWKGNGRLEQGVNLSLYNLLCHNNDLFHYVRTDRRGTVRYRAVGFVSPILPSVSYFIKL